MEIIDAVRIEIGDSNPESGILPGHINMTDEQIDYAAESERVVDSINPTTIEIGRTAARCLEIASVHWASQPEEVELGPSMEKGKQSDQLSKKASIFRQKWGFGSLLSRETSLNSQAPAYSGSGMVPASPGVN